MINFINLIPVPSNNNHNSIKRWYFASCGSIATLFSCLAMISAYQYRELKVIQEEYMHRLPIHTKTENIINEHARLTKEKNALLEAIEEYEKYTHYAKRPSDVLKAVTQNKKNKLKTFRLIKQSVSFQMCVQNINESVVIAQSLESTTIFDEVKLTSFKHGNPCAEACFEGKTKDN